MKLFEIERICPSSMWDNFCGDTEAPEGVIREREEAEELRIASLLEREALRREGMDGVL